MDSVGDGCEQVFLHTGKLKTHKLWRIPEASGKEPKSPVLLSETKPDNSKLQILGRTLKEENVRNLWPQPSCLLPILLAVTEIETANSWEQRFCLVLIVFASIATLRCQVLLEIQQQR